MSELNLSLGKIFLAGHRGMVGSAFHRLLINRGLSSDVIVRSKKELDLTDKAETLKFFESNNIDTVILAAAKVGGISANDTFPVQFMNENLSIAMNVINSAFETNVSKLLFLGSSCIYPKQARQPMRESELLSGPLEPTNFAYALAKITGLSLCAAYRTQYGADYRSIMPTNLYGLGDNYDGQGSHVIPALIKKFVDAKMNGNASVTVWGSGSARREFLFADDLASAGLLVLSVPESDFWSGMDPTHSHVNVGYGSDISIQELAFILARKIGFNGKIRFDVSAPEGPPKKLLDSSRISEFGWSAKTDLESGLSIAVDDYLRLRR